MVKKILTTTLLLLLFILKLPSLYILPQQIVFFTSHTIVKILVVAIFILSMFLLNNSKKILNKSLIIKLVLVSYIIDTLSIIITSDSILFIKAYHNLTISLLIFILAFVFSDDAFVNKTEKYIEVLVIIFIILELIMICFPENFLNIAKLFVQDEMYSALDKNINRGRFQFESDFELFIPFIITITMLSKNKKNFVLNYIIFILCVFLSIFSRSRTRLIQLLFVLISYLGYSLIKKTNVSILKLTKLVLISLIIIVFSLKISNTIYGTNIWNRIIFESQTEDIDTFKFRINSILDSFEYGLTTLFGTGLGNYFTIRNNNIYSNISNQDKSELVYQKGGILSPHNFFAEKISEGGILSLFIWIIILINMIIRDIRLLNRNQKNNIRLNNFQYIIGSWAVFIYFLFNPANTVYITAWFWFFRGILEKKYITSFT